ncbi:MAG: GH32 C-terminal domain-containing protein [Liquorilactobacillus satsumensis]|uniref:GH32 C-terminal domain-containing protein n=1 Tax=Liquorilactobacillus satsumensis TaxID=259059 RepID=UPI0039EAFD3B
MSTKYSQKEHYKMYKKGKKWAFAIIFIGGGFLLTDSQENSVKAQETSTVVAVDSSSQANSTGQSTSATAVNAANTSSTGSSSSADSSTVSMTEQKSSAETTHTSSTATSVSQVDHTESQTSTAEQVSSTTSTSSSTPNAAIGESSADATSISRSSTTTSETSSNTDEKRTGAATTDVAENNESAIFKKDTTSVATSNSNPVLNNSTKVEAAQYDEEYRNQFHYSPAKNWMNDPNGLFYDKETGLYNLYYQYNPEGNVWGNMSWGHAVSKDLINWTQEKVAISTLTNQSWEDFTYTNTTGNLAKDGEVRYVGVPTTNWGDANGKKDIFSGSIFVDTNNVSGLGKGAILAFYTADYQIATRINDGQDGGWGTWIGLSEIQEQHLAYSLDGGKTFVQYSADGNSANPQPLIPVTASRGGDSANFRDPNVVYDAQHKQFLMTVVSGQEALIYKSKNLLQWEYASSIQRQSNVGKGAWECPALIPMQVSGTNEIKWVFSVSVQQGAHATGSGMEYFVGSMDANGKWTPESSTTLSQPQTLDYGEDFYAGITFANLAAERTVMLGWESNWSYTTEAKTTPWYGNMTLPRELTLVKSSTAVDGYLLKNKVVSEIENNEKDNVISPTEMTTVVKNSEHKIAYTGETYKVAAKFSWDVKNPPKTVGFKVRMSADGQYYMTVGYDLKTKLFFVQRLKSGEPEMGSPRDQMNASVETNNGTITLTVYVDETSIEAFANDGEKSITQNFFMRPEYLGSQSTTGLVVFAQGGTANVTELAVNPIESIWNNRAKLTVNYLDTAGKPLAVAEQFSGKIGESYQAKAAQIAGYYLIGSETQNKNTSNLYTAKDQVINYLYQKVQTAITVKNTTLIAGPWTTWTAADNFIEATDIKGNAVPLSAVSVSGSVDPTKVGSYKVTYSYTDSQKKTVNQVAIVTVRPSLAAIDAQDGTLNAGSQTKWTPADNFNAASGSMGQKISLQAVTVSGNVDPTKPGKYKIKYSYTDAQGNVITKIVYVTVRAQAAVDHGKQSGTNSAQAAPKINGSTNWNPHSQSQRKTDKLAFKMFRSEQGKLAIQATRQNRQLLNKQKQLPQTSERQSKILILWGLCASILGSVGVFFGIRKRKSK